MVDCLKLCPKCNKFSFNPICPQCIIDIEKAWKDQEAIVHARIYVMREMGDLNPEFEVPEECRYCRSSFYLSIRFY